MAKANLFFVRAQGGTLVIYSSYSTGFLEPNFGLYGLTLPTSSLNLSMRCSSPGSDGSPRPQSFLISFCSSSSYCWRASSTLFLACFVAFTVSDTGASARPRSISASNSRKLAITRSAHSAVNPNLLSGSLTPVMSSKAFALLAIPYFCSYPLMIWCCSSVIPICPPPSPASGIGAEGSETGGEGSTTGGVPSGSGEGD